MGLAVKIECMIRAGAGGPGFGGEVNVKIEDSVERRRMLVSETLQRIALQVHHGQADEVLKYDTNTGTDTDEERL